MKLIHRLMTALEIMLAGAAGMFTNVTGGKKGYGTAFKRGAGTGSPETFETVGEVRSISEFGSERGLIDMTNMDSPNEFMEYILSMKDGVEFNLTVNFLPQTAGAHQGYTAGMIADHEGSVTRNFQMALGASAALGTFSFSALVRTWKTNSIEPNGAILATFGCKITGAISYV